MLNISKIKSESMFLYSCGFYITPYKAFTVWTMNMVDSPNFGSIYPANELNFP